MQPNAIQQAIARGQARFFEPEHASFTHVGLYVGQAQVVDATPDAGICLRSSRVFFDQAMVRARRTLGTTQHEQRRIATEARRWALAGHAYSHAEAAAAALAAALRPPAGSLWSQLLEQYQLSRRTRSGRQGPYASAFCGSLVNDLVASQVNRSIVDGQDCFAALPAAFSANTAQYHDVVLRW